MSEKILADRYKLVEQIGIGGMAIVYRAVDLRTGHYVAVKVLKPEFNSDAEFVGRFQREAEAASKMAHHNIVNLLDVGMDGENRYLVMEYVHGKTLKQVIQEKGRLNYQVAGQITIRILSALQHAHTNGIIHRDIKPQNILVHSDGHIKVADFGIARMANSSTLTKGDSVMGSVHYFSPEQASGQEVQATSDIYSTGIVLYEMLTGRVPFDGDNHVAIAMQHLRARPVPIEQLAPDVPLSVIAVCMKAMEKNPAYRYQSALDMATDLKFALSGRNDRVTALRGGPGVMLSGYVPNAQNQQGGPNPHGNGGDHPQPRKTPDRSRRTLRLVLTVVTALLIVTALGFGVRFIVNRVANTVAAPDFLGDDLTSAERTASRYGLNLEVQEINSTSAAGTVINQVPEADTSMMRGDTMVLYVSAGPASLAVPQITGSTQQDAVNLLQSYGLTMTVTEAVVSDTPAGVILSQVPESGTQCAAGDIIQVTVSGGSTYVPNLLDKTLDEARELIRSSSLTLNTPITYCETDDTSLHGLVKEQSPAADANVILNTAVSLTIWRVPSLTHSAQITLSLPQSDTTIRVRVTLNEDGQENTVWEGDCTADSSRSPVLEVNVKEAGTYSYKVYFDGEFKYVGNIDVS